MEPTDDAEPGGITPLPLPVGVGRVVFFGGSFDPPTLAHAVVGESARRLGAGDEAWLVFVPAARSPFKDGNPTGDAHRVAMLRPVAHGLDRAAVWTDEIDRGDSPSYWVDTLRRARALLPDARLWFIIGADQAAGFHRWREGGNILSLAQPIVVLRDPLSSLAGLEAALRSAGAWSDEQLAEWCGSVVEMPLIEGSATQVRGALAAGRDPSGLLDPLVLAYARKHGLYGAR